MSRPKNAAGENGAADMSVIGPRMKVLGDLVTEGTVRIEGRVEGDVEAGKAVVVGKDGEVEGDIRTEDSIVSGRIRGSVTAASRLEVQATARVDGEVHARRLQLDEGAVLNGTVRMGEVELASERLASSPKVSRSGPDSPSASS